MLTRRHDIVTFTLLEYWEFTFGSFLLLLFAFGPRSRLSSNGMITMGYYRQDHMTLTTNLSSKSNTWMSSLRRGASMQLIGYVG